MKLRQIRRRAVARMRHRFGSKRALWDVYVSKWSGPGLPWEPVIIGMDKIDPMSPSVVRPMLAFMRTLDALQ